MSRKIKLTGNQDMYDPWCMISKGIPVRFACFVLLAISEEVKT